MEVKTKRNCQVNVEECNICGGNGFKRVAKKAEYVLLKCINCGLIFVDYDELDLNEFYNKTRKEWVKTKTLTDWVIKEYTRGNERKYKSLESYMGSKGRMLDVGCSIGVFLSIAKRYGWNVTGVEIDEERAKAANEAYGVDVLCGRVEDVEFEDSFDCVIIFDCIEHVEDPASVLQKVYDVLCPGGKVILTLPNIEGLEPKTTYYLFYRTLGLWHHPDPPAHLYEFSPVTIEQLLSKIGFENVQIQLSQVSLGYKTGLKLNQITDLFANYGSTIATKSMIKRLCYAAVATPLFIAAKLLGMGDSMTVVAQRSK